MRTEAQPGGLSPVSRFAQRFIRTYQLRVAPGLGTRCRFQPTCSNYGMEAFRKYGFPKATAKTAWRLLRCNPWNKGPLSDPP